MKKTLISIIFLQLFFVKFSFSQRENTYQAEASTVLGTETTPFWMRANKYGLVPTKGNNLILSAGTYSDYQKTTKKINWGYGLNLGAFVGTENKFIIQEAYFKAKWKAFEFYVGRRKEIQGLVDTTLTSGSYIWSGNALPMPKVQIAIPEYTSLGGEGLVSIKGNYAHGWFESGRSDASGIFLHQKSGYFRIGKPSYKVKFYGGFNHQAQWGGSSKVLSIRKFESTFKDYLGVVSGKSNVGNDTTGLDPNNAGNRTGNHLGTLDLGFEINLKNSKLFIYRQSIFEDGSLFYLNNITDGLNGLSVSFKKNFNSNFKINKITIEYLNTFSQGGPEGSEALLASHRGQDNYFNNSQYLDGWSYKTTSIGSPFIMTNKEIGKEYNSLDQLFKNSFIQAYYIGIEGIGPKEIHFINKLSISKNWGSPGYRSSIKNQTSWSFLASKEFENRAIGLFQAYTEIGLDVGNLLSENFAIRIGIKKSWDNFPFNNHPSHKHNW